MYASCWARSLKYWNTSLRICSTSDLLNTPTVAPQLSTRNRTVSTVEQEDECRTVRGNPFSLQIDSIENPIASIHFHWSIGKYIFLIYLCIIHRTFSLGQIWWRYWRNSIDGKVHPRSNAESISRCKKLVFILLFEMMYCRAEVWDSRKQNGIAYFISNDGNLLWRYCNRLRFVSGDSERLRM